MMRAQPNMTVLYPCDAMSTERLIELMAYHPGPAYMRTSRPKTPVIYGPEHTFAPRGAAGEDAGHLWPRREVRHRGAQDPPREPEGRGDRHRRRHHRGRGAEGV